jgi:hypothetical protein
LAIASGNTPLANTLIAQNTVTAGAGETPGSASAPDVSGNVTSSDHDLIGDGTGSNLSNGDSGGDTVGTSSNPINPLLGPLANYGGPTLTMALLPGSPAIDAGSSAYGGSTDQRGKPRVGATDIGAFESQGFSIAVSSGNNQRATFNTAFAQPLVVAVTANNAVEPVAGGFITFTAPDSGASAILSGSPATIGSDGKASVTATANALFGTYTVSASATGIANPASFSLTNSTYVVTSTADDGSAGTLRYAINQANAGNVTEIVFAIGAVGSAQTIHLTSALPTLTASGVYINGLSQGGSSNTKQLITLDGTNAVSSSDGLLLQGANCIVSGLLLEHFNNGIEIAGSNNTIGGTTTGAGNILSGNSGDGVLIDAGTSGVSVLGNYIGTDVTGTKALANSIGVEVAGNNNIVGGASGSRNLISGNTKDGVLLDSGASGNVVEGNAIGVNKYDLAVVANGGNGIEVAGSNNTLGASYAVAPNEISGNSNDGVLLDSGSSGNQVLGNYIGTNHAGTAAVANKVGIEDAGTSNTIGGSVLGDKNVISGNSGDGVLVDSTASAETMQGNYIGTNVVANAALANGTNGVEVNGTGNTIGGNSGSSYFVRNFIAGNSQDGVLLDSGASGNQVLGNFIGVGVSGTHGVANATNGIEVAGSSNTVGGTVSGNKNVISGNDNDGVLLDNTATNNLIQGSYIGTDYTGRVALANSGNGIEIQGTANTVGGTSGSRNVISGNSNDGVRIDSGGSGNQVLGNAIGVNIYDSAAVANGGNGIEVAGSNNTLGTSYAVAPNEISGNTGDGVLLDSGSSDNQVLGNYIGTNHSGTAAVANKVGIEDAGNHNTIGGSVLGARNVISGNSGDGILLDSGATGETMQGNYIGLNYTAKTALANGSNGVEVQGSNNLIGGNSGFHYFVRNFISGNSGDGLLIANGATGNVVQGNFIGLDVSGTNGVGNSIGIEVAGNSNTLGGASFGLGNVLSGNSSDGLRLDSLATNNLVQRNDVGTDYTGTSAVSNGGNGVTLVGNNNTLGGSAVAAGNIIAYNSGDGVLVSVGVGNTITSNSIFANTGGGIALSNGGNNNVAAPNLLTAVLTGSTLTVTGSFTAPTANVSYVLQFFANPSGDAEGKVYLGSLTVTPTSTGTENFTFTTTTTVTGTDQLITATLTDNTADTSQFSNGVTVS